VYDYVLWRLDQEGCSTWWRIDAGRILVGILREMHCFENLGLSEVKTLQWIFKNGMGDYGMYSCSSE
jgi:hypothetical protein